ncbi:MAG: hypothetical protein AAF402_15805 [Pseudomonadota bacterium]
MSSEFRRFFTGSFASILWFTPFYASAQNTVVVVPLGGEDASQFRIVSHGTGSDAGGFIGPSEANQGRLEYTPDASPGPDSEWGTVCDDNLATPAIGGSNVVQQTGDEFANLVCHDMGYEGGNLIPSLFTRDGSLPKEFLLTSLESLSLIETVSCVATEDAGVDCHLTEQVTFRPELQMPCSSQVAIGTALPTDVVESDGGKVEVVPSLGFGQISFSLTNDGSGNLSAAISADGFADISTGPFGNCSAPTFPSVDSTFFSADNEDWIITDTDLSSDGISVFFNSVTFARRPFASI